MLCGRQQARHGALPTFLFGPRASVGIAREKVSFINENTPRAPTGQKNTRKPARLAILE